jgi:hypothetical protein
MTRIGDVNSDQNVGTAIGAGLLSRPDGSHQMSVYIRDCG